MERITEKQLENLCARINKATGSPETPWSRDGSGQLVSNVGNYHLSGAYGGVSLHRMASYGGGSVHDVFSCGHTTKRDLYNRMWAFLAGLSQKDEVTK